MLSQGKERKFLVPALLFLAAVALFSFNLQYPATRNFDEFHYVPAAQKLWALQENPNWEHPPLGKLILGVGLALAGDNPVGWRCMSVLFGGITLLGMYFWGLAVFGNRRSALTVALLTLVNQLLYVQARIGMLDTFMFAFLSFALAAVSGAWRPHLPARTVHKLLTAAGILFGLAAACKWSALIPWGLALAGVSLAKAVRLPWLPEGSWQGLSWKQLGVSLGLLPVVFYYLPFTIFLFFEGQPRPGLLDILFRMQWAIWDGQLRVVSDHPYMSHWYDWATLKRPIWYAFDHEGASQEWVRGVVLLGNPVLMWGGLAAIALGLWSWLKERSREAFLIVAAYLCLYLGWVLIPRKISFYYYYYPAGMTLSLAWTWILDEADKERPAWSPWLRWAFFVGCLGFFLYFLPILGAFKIPAESFRRWMWLDSWI